MLVCGGFFVAGALMWWAGYQFLGHRIGMFVEADDFARIRKRFRRWIWTFRVHLFGHVTCAMGFAAIAVIVGDPENENARAAIAAGSFVAATGLIVSALAAAYYYHFGAWGAVEMEGKPVAEVDDYVRSLRPGTEYITCLVRFGRVFFGLGQTVLGAGLLFTAGPPAWFAIPWIVLGVAAMALTMAFPDNLDLGIPLFHANALWMLATGVLLLIPEERGPIFYPFI